MVLIAVFVLRREVVGLVVIDFNEFKNLLEQRGVLAGKFVVTARYQETLRGLIYLLLVHDVFQQTGGDVGKYNTDDFVGRIADRGTVCRCHTHYSHFVFIRFAPKRLACGHGNTVILLIGIYDMISPYLH